MFIVQGSTLDFFSIRRDLDKFAAACCTPGTINWLVGLLLCCEQKGFYKLPIPSMGLVYLPTWMDWGWFFLPLVWLEGSGLKCHAEANSCQPPCSCKKNPTTDIVYTMSLKNGRQALSLPKTRKSYSTPMLVLRYDLWFRYSFNLRDFSSISTSAPAMAETTNGTAAEAPADAGVVT